MGEDAHGPWQGWWSRAAVSRSLLLLHQSLLKSPRKAKRLYVLAQSPTHGAEPVRTGSLAPASVLDAVAKSQPSLNAKQLRGLESCPNFYSARLKTHQLAKAARRLGGSSAFPRHSTLRLLTETASTGISLPLGVAFGETRWSSPCP